MKINKLAIAIIAALASSSVIAGVPTSDNTKTQGMGSFAFGVSNQSVWAANGPGRTTINWDLSTSDWNSVFGRPARKRLGVGGIASECILGACASFGAAAGIQLEAYFLPYVNLVFDPGTFDAVAQFAPSVTYQFKGLGTDRFSLDTSSGLNAGTSSLNVNAPRFALDTGIRIETNLSLFAEACFVDCFLDKKYDIPGTDVGFNVDLLRVDTFTGQFAHLNIDPREFSLDTFAKVVTGEANASDLFYKQISAREVAEEVQRQAEQREKDGVANTIENLLEIDAGPINIALSNPFTENVSGSYDGRSFNASLGGDLLDISLDIDEVIGYAFGLPSGGTLEFDKGVVSAELTLGDINAGPTIDLIQEVSVTPDLMVNIEFDNEVFIGGKIGKQTSYYGSWEDLPQFALLAESNILRGVETREDKTVTATTEFSLNATVSNRTYLDVGAQITGELLSASIAIDDFDALSIGPLFSFREEASLFEVDIYNDQFSLNRWSGLDADGMETGTRTFQGEELTFNGFGEIVFQARGYGGNTGGANDSFYNDEARINEALTVDQLIRYEAFERYYGGIQDGVLQDRLNREYTVDQEQAGHVMRDGKLTVNANRTMIIEADASVELGKDNNYAIRNIFDEGDDIRQLGLINNGDLQVYGELYSNAGTQNENYVFRNAADGQIEVGANGWLKFDGNLQNEGDIENYGRIENTAENSWSTGSIENKVGANIDLYGSFVMHNDPNNNEQYQNDGTITVNRGGELELTSASGQGSLVNTGDLVIRKGGELRLSNTSNPASSTLTNYGLVTNGGYVLNTSGQTINNGSIGNLDATAMLEWQGTKNEIRRLYNGQDNPNNYVEAYEGMEVAAQDNREAKLYWHDHPFDNEAAYAATSNQLNEIRKTGGTLDQAYTAIQAEVDTLKSAGFGVWENNKDALLVNQGTINNNAVMINNVGASIYNESLINNNGYMSNTGSIVSHSGIGIINKGVIENGTSAVGFAGISTLVNIDSIDNTGTINNNDTFVNYGELYNENVGPDSNASIVNSGLISNVGHIENVAQFSNERGAQTDNYSTIVNNATIDNHGFINNGIANNDATVINDNASVKAEALAFYQTSQTLAVQNLEFTKLTTKFDNESARLSANGFKGELSSDNANEFAIHLYEKYLVSDQLYGYGPEVNFAEGAAGATLSEKRNGIRDWVNQRGQLSTSEKAACNSNILECYKIFYGARAGLDIFAIDYALGSNNLGIQQYTMYADSIFEGLNGGSAMGDPNDDQNRFEWTMLMMLDAEGLGMGNVLSFDNPPSDNPEDIARSLKINYFGYGDENNFGQGDINNGVDAIYARWLDQVFLESTSYGRNGQSFSFNDISSPKPGTLSFDLVSIYQNLTDVMNGILASNTTLSGLNIDLANVTSLTANLTNNETINNYGVINNRATLDNSVGASINNDGVLLNAQDATINNDGDIITDNDGILVSQGEINNTGLIEVNSGTMMNNGMIDNKGQILLSAVYDPQIVDDNGQSSVSTALFINNRSIINDAGGLIQVGINTFEAATDTIAQKFNYFESTFENFGEIVNIGSIIVNDIMLNAGMIENRAGSSFENNGLLNNTESGVITFAQSSSLGGSVINNGIIFISENQQLTLTSGLTGSGIFYGDTMLDGANVNPGNSAGQLTFANNLSVQDTNWFMDIFGTERGMSFDAIDIIGDLTLSDMESTFEINSFIDFDSLFDFEFDFMYVVGDILDGDGNAITDLSSWTIEATANWFGRWYQNNDGWWLGFEYLADRDTYNAQYPPGVIDGPTEVPEPRLFMLLMFGFAFVVLGRKGPALRRSK
jgi:hypothetical protein